MKLNMRDFVRGGASTAFFSASGIVAVVPILP
jgi:hypothetical protein